MENGDTLRKRADADSAIGTDPSMVVYGGAVGGCGSSYMADRQADRCTVGSFPAGEGWLLLSGEICGLLLFSELANSIFYYCMVCGDAAAARTLEQKLGEKAAVLPLLVMEDEQVLNQLQRQRAVSNRGVFPNCCFRWKIWRRRD